MGCLLSKPIEGTSLNLSDPAVGIALPVASTVVDNDQMHHELFRCKDIVVTRSPTRQGSLCYVVMHKDCYAKFNSYCAVVEAFISEVRAQYPHDGVSSSTMPVTNPGGIHLTYISLKYPADSTEKLMTLISSLN